jgi:hypothetical protein
MATATSIRFLAGPEAAAVVFGALFMGLPVHAGGALIVNLHAVHAAVALAGLRVLGEDHRQGDVGAAVLRPAGEDGDLLQIEAVLLNDLLARAGGDFLREERAHFGQFRQHGKLAEQALGHLHLEVLADAVGDLLEGVDLQGNLHAALAGEGVDEHRHAVAFRILEQKRGTVVLHRPVGELGDLQNGIDLKGDALQFAGFFQRGDEVA